MLKLGSRTYEEVDDAERARLKEKCQDNGWLQEGGYAWQDDPFLEDFPYSFVKTENVGDLRAFFEHGNWALRQGIVYEDLAFVQQVDGGDEWWTLKQLPDGSWLDFESWSFGSICREPERFAHAIESMHVASPEQCAKLDYMLPEKEQTPAMDALVSRAESASEASRVIRADRHASIRKAEVR